MADGECYICGNAPWDSCYECSKPVCKKHCIYIQKKDVSVCVNCAKKHLDSPHASETMVALTLVSRETIIYRY
jgi:hypothetical protein